MGAFDDLPNDRPSGGGAFDNLPNEKKDEELTLQERIRQAILKSPQRGLLDTVATVASGAVAPVVGGYKGIVGSMLPGPPGQGAKWAEDAQDRWSYDPQTGPGKFVSKALAIPGRVLDWAGEKAGDVTADKIGPLAGTVVRSTPTALAAALPLASRFMRQGELPSAVAARESSRLANLQADTAATAAREGGYTLPPTQVNPSLSNKLLEGFGGKIKTGQDLSIKNQVISQDKIRSAFGLPEGTILDGDTFNAIRKDKGAPYDVVRGTGTSKVSNEYVNDLVRMADPIEKFAAAYKADAPPAILKKIVSVMEPTINADAALLKIRELRNDANIHYKAGDKVLGGQYKDLANIVEDELTRHAERKGMPPEAIQNLREARKNIAQTYTVEKYIKPNGEVDAVGLSKELSKKPLEGDIRDVAEFGANFPKAAQLPSRIGGVPTSPLDYVAALIHPKAAVGLYARPVARKILGSDMYQNMAVKPSSYGPSLGSRLMESLDNPGALGAASASTAFGQVDTEEEKRRAMLARLLGN